jgi:hypothetical protein
MKPQAILVGPLIIHCVDENHGLLVQLDDEVAKLKTRVHRPFWIPWAITLDPPSSYSPGDWCMVPVRNSGKEPA